MPGHHLVCHGIILVLSLCRRQNSLCMQRHRLSNRERLIADPSSPFGFLTGPLPVPLWRRLTILPVHKGSIPVNVQSNTRLVRARDGAVPAAYMLVHAHIASKAPGTILQAPRPEQVSTMDGSAGIFVYSVSIQFRSLSRPRRTNPSVDLLSCLSATVLMCVRPKGKPSPRNSCTHSQPSR